MKKTFKAIVLFLALLLIVPVNLSLAESLDESDYYVELEEVSIKDMVVKIKFSKPIDPKNVYINIEGVELNNFTFDEENAFYHKVNKLPVSVKIVYFVSDDSGNNIGGQSEAVTLRRDNVVGFKNNLEYMYVMDGKFHLSTNIPNHNASKVNFTINGVKYDTDEFIRFVYLEDFPIPSTVTWEYRDVKEEFYIDKENVFLYGDENLNMSTIKYIRQINNLELEGGNFVDVSTDHWAYLTIRDLALRSKINGYPDGTFRPENNITVREFNTLLSRVLDEYDSSVVKPKQTNVELEKIKGKWGYDENKFVFERLTEEEIKDFNISNLERPITREEVALLIDRTLRIEEIPFMQILLPNPLSDINEYKYNDSIQKLNDYWIIMGYEDSEFKGENNIKRSEVATIIDRLIR